MEILNEFQNDLAFLLERIKIEKIEKFVAYLYDEREYVKHIKNLKQTLNHKTALKKVQRVIKFNQGALLKPYIDMDTELRKRAKNDFEKDLLRLMNNVVFGKTMENVRKHRYIILVASEKRRTYLVS